MILAATCLVPCDEYHKDWLRAAPINFNKTMHAPVFSWINDEAGRFQDVFISVVCLGALCMTTNGTEYPNCDFTKTCQKSAIAAYSVTVVAFLSLLLSSLSGFMITAVILLADLAGSYVLQHWVRFDFPEEREVSLEAFHAGTIVLQFALVSFHGFARLSSQSLEAAWNREQLLAYEFKYRAPRVARLKFKLIQPARVKNLPCNKLLQADHATDVARVIELARHEPFYYRISPSDEWLAFGQELADAAKLKEEAQAKLMEDESELMRKFKVLQKRDRERASSSRYSSSTDSSLTEDAIPTGPGGTQEVPEPPDGSQVQAEIHDHGFDYKALFGNNGVNGPAVIEYLDSVPMDYPQPEAPADVQLKLDGFWEELKFARSRAAIQYVFERPPLDVGQLLAENVRNIEELADEIQTTREFVDRVLRKVDAYGKRQIADPGQLNQARRDLKRLEIIQKDLDLNPCSTSLLDQVASKAEGVQS